MLRSVSTNIPITHVSSLDVHYPLKKNVRNNDDNKKKSNHVYIGKEARNVERKQRHHSRMVSTYPLTSLFVTNRCVKKERKQHL